MGKSAKDIASGTQVMGLFAQVLSGIGFVLIILGAVLLIIDLFEELRDEESGFELAAAITSGAIMLNGFMLAALGQALTALRSIAVNCATIAEKG